MARRGTLTVRLVGDDSRLNRTLDSVGGKVARFGKVAAAAGGAAAVAFGVKAVTGAVELNETLSKTEQVFGSASGDVIGFADEMADAFGTPKQEILDAASNIGLVAQASGLATDEAAAMSTEMAQLAADASSFFNVPLPDALEKIRAGLVGEAEPLRSFGVLLSAAAVEAKALELGISDGSEELTEQQKVMARSAIITEQMSAASGDLERTQDSLANRVRALQGRFENFAAEVGQNVIPWIETLWDWLENVLPPAIDTLKQVWRENEATIMEVIGHLREIVISFGNILADVMGAAVADSDEGASSISESVGTIADAIEQVSSAIDGFMDGFEAITSLMDTPVGRFLRDVFDSMTNLLSVFNDAKAAWNGLQRALGRQTSVEVATPRSRPVSLPYDTGGLQGFRAQGGNVTRGPWLVGEDGPEVLTMPGMGRVTPTSSGGGPQTVNNITINMPPGSDGDDVVQKLRRWNRVNGPVPVSVSG